MKLYYSHEPYNCSLYYFHKRYKLGYLDVLTFKMLMRKVKVKINLTVYNENYTCEYGGLEPLVHLLYILSSTLVGNTQIKLMLHEYNLQHYSCDLIYIVALNVFTSFDNQSHNTPIKMYTILTNRVQCHLLLCKME